MSSASFTGESDNAFQYRSALGGGGGATFHLTRAIGIRSELMYAVRGAVARDAVIDGEQTQLEARFAVAYIDIPLIVVLRLPQTFPQPYAFGGAAYSRNIDAQLTLVSPSGESVTNGDSSIRSSDFSLVAGLGVAFSVGTEELFVEGRFVGGQQNVRPERPDAPLNNRSFLIIAGIRF